MIIPAAAKLNKRHARKKIGYTILSVDRSVYSSFTTQSVSEVRPGYYVAVNGVQVPDEGGFILWGLKTKIIVEDSFDPIPADIMGPLSQVIHSGISETKSVIAESSLNVMGSVAKIDLTTPIREAQRTIVGSVEKSQELVLKGVEQSTLETNLLTESLTEQINNRFKLDTENVQLIETLIARIETNQGEEIALGNQITDALRLISEVRESTTASLNRLDNLEQSIRNNADIDATIEEQKVLINEFFGLLETSE